MLLNVRLYMVLDMIQKELCDKFSIYTFAFYTSRVMFEIFLFIDNQSDILLVINGYS